MQDRSRRPGNFDSFTLRTPRLAVLCLAALAVGCGRPGAKQGSAAPIAQDSADAPAAPKRKPARAVRKVASLDAAVKLAKSSFASLEKIKDYTCTFVKRERVGGVLLDEERLEMKVRHKPFSVYLRFLQPASLAGQEAIYVEGQNEGKLIGHMTGIKGQVVGAVALDPTGFLAMRNNRYPITNVGMKNLVALLIKLGERKDLLQGCRVEFVEGERVDDRPCLCVEIRNPRPTDELRLAAAKVWVDEAWNVPVRFESWEWPEATDEKPVLAEQYKYLDLKLDPGLTSRDFDPKNPNYGFE